MDMVKIGILGVAGAFLGLFLRQYRNEYGMLIGIASCMLIFAFLISKLELVLSYVDTIRSLLPVDERYFAMILKMIGITYAAEFATDLCRDAGYGSVAGQIEMFAKLSILLVSMPVLMGLIQTVGEFL